MVQATQKTVIIKIDPNDMATLKESKYNLCFAKGVIDKNGSVTTNVVWEAYPPIKYLAENTFQWTPVYQLFGSNSFSDGSLVEVNTNIVNINLGEQSILDQNGTLGSPSTGGISTSITLVNNFGPIHPAINQLANNQQQPTSIYVAEAPIVKGEDTLTPVDQVLVWFQQDIETSTMFSTARSISTMIDLTHSNRETRLYKNGEWSVPGTLIISEPPTILKIILVSTGAITASILAQKITTYLTGVYSNITVDVHVADMNVTVTYQEKSGLNLQEVKFINSLKDSPTLRDTLMAFTANSLAAIGSGFTTLSAQ